MDPERFALRLKLYKLDDHGVYGLLLLHELLLKQGCADLELVQGYLTVTGETCWHCWMVHKGDIVIDLGRLIATLKDPQFSRCDFMYSRERPEATKVHEDPANLQIWESRNEKTLWKEAPKKFQEFRSLMHKKTPPKK